jgi:DNA-binding transcriptional MocR family regulator
MPPLYEKIADELKTDITHGYYKTSRKLPSVRELAGKYQCSINTIIHAYEILKSSHLIYTVPQSGYYVVEQLIELKPPPQASFINLSTGNPIIGDMHTPDLKHCLDRAVDIYKNKSAAHPVQATDSLRNLLPKYLAETQVFTAPHNIYINLGIQAALSILSQLSLPNGKDTILIEQPTYQYFINFLKLTNAKVLGIPRDENGLDLTRLEMLFKRNNIKFFYTVPRYHNPLGTAYPLAQRKAIAYLAQKYDVYIVEDDYCGDLTFDKRYDPIYAYGDHHHHIYLRNYSKILPWIRIGLLVLPTHLISSFEQYIEYSYYYSYFRPSMISLATLEIYIRSKLLNKHTNALQKELSERSACLKKYFPLFKEHGLTITGRPSGFYSYLKLASHINETQLVENLRRKNVMVAPGKAFYLDSSFHENGIRLSIAQAHAQDIQRGCEIILEELKNMHP